MAVYEGSFESMDGPVTITRAHIEALCDNHNRRIAESNGNIGACPPMQLDHEKAARQTVGRVNGLARVEPRFIKGRERLALVIDRVRFLGSENVAPATDGRWSSVSIGANLDTCTLDELSIVPFPAAEHAALLSKGAATMTTEQKERLKKHLMKTTKCSADEADEKLSKLSEDEQKKLAADADEDEKKLASDAADKAQNLAAGDDDKDKDDKKDKDDDKKLGAPDPVKARLAAKLADVQKQLAEVKMATRAGDVTTRLAKVRAEARITPVVQKRLAKLELHKRTDGEIKTAFEILDALEPVVPVGQVGSTRVVDLSGVGKDVASTKVATLEAEALADMPFARLALQSGGGGVNLGGAPAGKPTEVSSIANLIADEEAKVARLAARADASDAADAARDEENKQLNSKVIALSATLDALQAELNA